MDSPYRINNNKKKKPKQPTDTKSVPNKKSKNNIMRGGNISNIHTLSGKELIDQGLNNDKADSILENKQEDNKKNFYS